MAACPSIRLSTSVRPHGTTRLPQDGFFVKFDSSIIRKSADKIKVTLKSGLKKRVIYMYIWYLTQFFSVWEMFHRSVVQKSGTRFMSNNLLPKIVRFKRKCGKIQWRQVIDANIIRIMVFAYWVTKATDTHSECVIIIAFPMQEWLVERA